MFARHSLSLAFVVALLVPRMAGAQIIRRPPSVRYAPTAYVSGSIGFMQLATVRDGSTESDWNFGDAAQWRVSLEKPLQGNTALGVAATFARVPLTYESFGAIGCGTCDADANVTQLFAFFHSGGSSLGFYQVIELAAGTTIYSSFRERATGTKIGPDSPDFDLAFAFGYGFGYTVSPNLQVQLVQDFGTSLHQRTGLAGGEGRSAAQYTTRIGVRYGLGR